MKTRLLHMIMIIVLSVGLSGFSLSKGLMKKVKNEVEKSFGVSGFELKQIQFETVDYEDLPMRLDEGKLFKIYEETSFLGYAYLDQAPSKTAKFDYLVLFDADLRIVNSKVLIYREEYGGEIGSKRWLRQFIGKTTTDRVSHNTNIDGIAGATISVRSFTKSIDALLQSLHILNQKGLL